MIGLKDFLEFWAWGFRIFSFWVSGFRFGLGFLCRLRVGGLKIKVCSGINGVVCWRFLWGFLRVIAKTACFVASVQ